MSRYKDRKIKPSDENDVKVTEKRRKSLKRMDSARMIQQVARKAIVQKKRKEGRLYSHSRKISDEWEERKDDRKGSTYYVNTITNSMTKSWPAGVPKTQEKTSSTRKHWQKLSTQPLPDFNLPCQICRLTSRARYTNSFWSWPEEARFTDLAERANRNRLPCPFRLFGNHFDSPARLFIDVYSTNNQHLPHQFKFRCNNEYFFAKHLDFLDKLANIRCICTNALQWALTLMQNSQFKWFSGFPLWLAIEL